MREDNGILIIEDSKGNKTKYKIVTCVEISKKTYLLYTKDNNPKDDILVFVSIVSRIDKNKYELKKVNSEIIMNKIKTILNQILNNNIDTNTYDLKCLNINQKYILDGKREIILIPKVYEKIRKDYNANKKERDIVAPYEFIKEYTIEKVEILDKSFIDKFKIDEKYIRAIRNI